VLEMLLSILAMTAVTIFTRAAPFLFFMKRRPPPVLDYLQRYIPPMIMTILVLNALKGLRFDIAPWGFRELASIALVAGLQLWKRNVLLSIGGGTALYMVLIRIVGQ
jgi:branched-subunit amino acid transport protein AzlD